ncbi:outer membrane protein [Pseudorhodoplanes sinuspersici]|nr:outer membrane protein [Pseudorhodoplanes sinuspersici]
MKSMRLGLIALSATMVSGAALAADIPPRTTPAYVAPANPYDIILEIGAGAQVAPAYEGASVNQAQPFPVFKLHYLAIPGFAPITNSRFDQGFSFSPSFRYISKRKASDYSQLAGLNDVDATFELGGKFAYTFGIIRPWVAVRQGFGGSDGVVGETGLDFIWRPDPVMELTLGPRASFATSAYMEAYFGVTPAEAARSPFLTAYSPGGGFKGVGAELSARYEVSSEWAVVGKLAYEKLIGDAADSPIVKVGDENQWTAQVGLSYKFGMRLFGN